MLCEIKLCFETLPRMVVYGKVLEKEKRKG